MKRFLIALALVLLPSALFAQTDDRDMLLTDAGILYTIESATVENEGGPATRILKLTVEQEGEETQVLDVPSTLGEGSHSAPSLAWDSGSDTLFIFWQKEPNRMSSELLLCSYSDGAFSDATSIDNAVFHHRYNLKIALTRYVNAENEEGEWSKEPELNIHAVWWDMSGGSEKARYALITTGQGAIRGIDIRDLLDFVKIGGAKPPSALDPDYAVDLFRHPAVFEVASRDAVEIVFGDWEKKRFDKVRVTPIRPSGVLTVPDGVWGGDVEPPIEVQAASVQGPVTILPGVGNRDLLFYFRSEEKMSYLLYRDEKWSELRSLSLGEKLNYDQAVGVLQRLIASE